jgi:hypothetical protein
LLAGKNSLDITTLEKQFHEKALAVYENGKKATGYRGTRYLQKVRKDGGLAAAKSWLKKRSGNDAPTGGFLKLVDLGRLDLSLEAIVITEPWSGLFTEEELQVARNRLGRYGYFDSSESIATDAITLPEEVDPSLREGARTTITVNTFERNPKARKKCLEHYGSQCVICGINFGSFYGSEADGFIHVHHLCPPSAIGKEYTVDPVADLRPVCPNCHAVIHLRKPPYTIEAVRQMLRKCDRASLSKTEGMKGGSDHVCRTSRS